MRRAYYTDSLAAFLEKSEREVLGHLAACAPANIEAAQRDAWLFQIGLLRSSLRGLSGRGAVHFEYAIPRLGRRIDTVLLIDHVLFVVEFKVGEREFTLSAHDQVFDYALDLKNFHETTHALPVAPILVATEAKKVRHQEIVFTPHDDGLLVPIYSTAEGLRGTVDRVLEHCGGPRIDRPCGSRVDTVRRLTSSRRPPRSILAILWRKYRGVTQARLTSHAPRTLSATSSARLARIRESRFVS